jgi:hypothetical protein
LIKARIIKETVVVEMAFINLDRTSLIAHHELLEGQEAEIPTISLFICDKLSKSRRSH